MMESLITSLHKNLNFDGARTVQYSWLREQLDELFGPVTTYSPTMPVADMNEKQKLECKARVAKDNEATKKGYYRTKEKVKYFN